MAEEEKKYMPKNTSKELNAEARVFIAQTTQDIDALKGYLDVMAKFPTYSAMNCAHIAMHRPEATQLFSADKIKEAGGFINRGEKGVPIVAPEFKPGKDGEPGRTYMNVKYLFARDQQHGAKLPYPKTYDAQTVYDAMRQVDTVEAPSTREGIYVLGKHFDLPGVYIDKLPEMAQTENLEELLTEAVDHMKSVQKEVKAFVHAVEQKCDELLADKAINRNEHVASMFMRAAERSQAGQAVQADAPQSAPVEAEQPEPAEGAAKEEARQRTDAAKAPEAAAPESKSANAEPAQSTKAKFDAAKKAAEQRNQKGTDKAAVQQQVVQQTQSAKAQASGR